MDSFALKLLASFLVGGAWISLTTIAAERLGPRLGGWLGGLPSTVVVAMLFIGWTQGDQAVFEATTAFPLTMAVNAVYLIAFAVLSRRSLTAAVTGALLVWAALQALVVMADPHDFGWAIGGWALGLVAGTWILRRLAPPAQDVAARLTFSPREIVGRAAFGGAVISLAVLLSKIGGPLFGSVFASFPAVFTSTLWIAARSAGLDFSRSLLTPLMVSAVFSVVVYAAALRFAIGPLGLLGASGAAYGISLVSAGLTYLFLHTHRT
ncbi:MAG: hypothetical protein A2Y93_12880 [Chloroflexi bacterium RBG_13_68_17]|nr:MAG: hypothetical protein A2Y93_12880 [Chloroflexi bacterium RBG_13_68_17]